jgi:HAD superfamily hydrolase (TIGR01662 family)
MRHNRKMNKYQAVLFDLDGTLRFSRPPYAQAFYDYAVRLGVSDSLESRRRAAQWAHYYWAQSEELVADMRDLWDEQEQRFWLNYAVRSLLAFDCSAKSAQSLAPEVSRYMREEHQSEDIVPEEVPITLQALKDAGYRLGLLSNRTRPYNELLDQLGLAQYFEVVLAAGEIDCWKPEPGIFLHVLDRMALDPRQALYVGDNYYADILGAQRAGLSPVLYDPEQVFPDASCPVIQHIADLLSLLNGRH